MKKYIPFLAAFICIGIMAHLLRLTGHDGHTPASGMVMAALLLSILLWPGMRSAFHRIYWVKPIWAIGFAAFYAGAPAFVLFTGLQGEPTFLPALTAGLTAAGLTAVRRFRDRRVAPDDNKQG